MKDCISATPCVFAPRLPCTHGRRQGACLRSQPPQAAAHYSSGCPAAGLAVDAFRSRLTPEPAAARKVTSRAGAPVSGYGILRDAMERELAHVQRARQLAGVVIFPLDATAG